MEIAFDNLIRLQHVDKEIDTISSFLEDTPAKIEAIDEQVKAADASVLRAKEMLSANQKKRRDLESQVKDFKVQASKFKRQLNEVKTNKEYTALLKEIEETERKADKIEEDIINEMIASDDIEKEIKAANVKKAEEEARLNKEKEGLFQEQKEFERKKVVFSKEREALLAQIPPDQLRLYLRISKKMNGLALSPVMDAFCSICQMRVRPQLVNEIMEMKKIVICEACGRILYWQKSRDEDVPEELADNPDKVDDSTAG